MTGWDELSSRILKKVSDMLAPHIAHLINSILKTATYPLINKISKILPLNKPGKNILLPDSYRPINNRPVIEKIIEEHFIEIFIEFIELNNILHNNHHGGRVNHSPETAMANIHLGLGINCDNNLIGTLFTTDLSAAYDTVDHTILLDKLEYFGIRDNELDVIKSFLNNRRQYVEIDRASSKLEFVGNRSVIQGSKIAGLLYTIYTNEIPDIYKLIHNNYYTAITGRPTIKFANTTHLTVNFVDDSTNVIATKEFDIIKPYLEQYYCLIKKFYDINKLQINTDKNQVCIYFKGKSYIKKIKEFSFTADNYVIKNKNSIKILGVYLNSELKIGQHINTIISQCYNKVHSIKMLSKYTDINTRLKFINAHMLSRLLYMLPLISSANNEQFKKIHNLIMFSARTIIGNYCFKVSCKKYLNRLIGFHLNNS